MSKERPILFNTEMVQAIQTGRKTQTRRLVKQPPIIGDIMRDAKGWYYEDGTRNGHSLIPPYSPGDILWVRETWGKLTECNVFPPYEPHQERFIYRADVGDPDHFQAKWRPSIHMPKEAARIFLRVKDIRVERLQEITEEQAILEGCSTGTVVITCDPMGVEVDPDDPQDWTAVEDFEYIWNSTIKPADKNVYGWKANPWVWVITFEQCQKPEGWCEARS